MEEKKMKKREANTGRVWLFQEVFGHGCGGVRKKNKGSTHKLANP